jgi:hypothetical protein
MGLIWRIGRDELLLVLSLFVHNAIHSDEQKLIPTARNRERQTRFRPNRPRKRGALYGA